MSDIRDTSSASSKDFSLGDFIGPLRRRRRFLIIAFFSCFAILMVAALAMGPRYTSHMEILVDRGRLDPVVTTESTAQMLTVPSPVTEEETNSEVELLTSRDVLEKVAIATGMTARKKFSLGDLLHPNDTDQEKLARAVKSLAKKIKAEATIKTNLIEVTFSSDDPDLSYAVLHYLGQFYTEKNVEVHRPAGSYEVFSQESNRYRASLEEAEAKVRDFEQAKHVAAPDVQKTDLALQAASAVGTLNIAEQAVAADEERIRSDRQQMSAIPQRIPTMQTAAAPDKLLADLGASLTAAGTRRTQLALKYEPSYPLVREADQEIAQINSAIAKAEASKNLTETTGLDPTFEILREELAKSESDRAAQVSTVTAAKRAIDSIQEQMVKLDVQSMEQQDLVREAKASESNYLLYRSKTEQERAQNLLDSTKVANVAIAVPPAIPVLPILSWLTTTLIVFGAAFVLSLGLTYSAEYLDPTFHSPAQVVDTLGIPVVLAFSKKTA